MPARQVTSIPCTTTTSSRVPRAIHREQVWPGDVLTCSGTVTAVIAEPEGDRISLDLAATRQTGGVAISGTAEFLITQNAQGRTTDSPDGS